MSEVQSVDSRESIDLTSLTMVFITRNRQELVLKNSRFYQRLGASIVVLDGSDSPIAEKDQGSVADRFTYIYSFESLERRLSLAAKFVHTPFTIVSTDDDLLVPSALQKSIKFLFEHPEILSCSGRAIGFKRSASKLNFLDCYPEHDVSKNSLLPSSVILRTFLYFRSYSSRYFYSVYRTKDWIPIYTNFVGERPLPRNYLEFIIEFRACLKGSHHILPNLFWLRNFTNAPIRADEKYRIFAKPADYIAVVRETFSKAGKKEGCSFLNSAVKSLLISLIIFALDIKGSLVAFRNKLRGLTALESSRLLKVEETFELKVLLEAKSSSYSEKEIGELLRLV